MSLSLSPCLFIFLLLQFASEFILFHTFPVQFSVEFLSICFNFLIDSSVSFVQFSSGVSFLLLQFLYWFSWSIWNFPFSILMILMQTQIFRDIWYVRILVLSWIRTKCSDDIDGNSVFRDFWFGWSFWSELDFFLRSNKIVQRP